MHEKLCRIDGVYRNTEKGVFVRKKWERRHDAPGRLVCSRLPPLAQGGGAQHRVTRQRGLGAPIRGSSPAGKTDDPAGADLPTARACGRTCHRGHLGQSPWPVRLHSASTGYAPRGLLPDSPETDTDRALHRAHKGDGAYVAPRDTGPLLGEKQDAYQRGRPAVAHGGVPVAGEQ